jgi:two-component system response regulator
VPRVSLRDLKLPKMDGLKVLRREKATSAPAGSPIVVLTASTEERDVIESWE